MDRQPMHRVIVYGTLKRGFPNHHAGRQDVGGMVMSAGIVWLLSPVVFWASCTVAYTAIEGLVPGYRTRFAVMIVAGVAVGALASGFGYTFFVLTAIHNFLRLS